jgi:hypothetical protein
MTTTPQDSETPDVDKVEFDCAVSIWGRCKVVKSTDARQLERRAIAAEKRGKIADQQYKEAFGAWDKEREAFRSQVLKLEKENGELKVKYE